jgi:hypothetical protein
MPSSHPFDTPDIQAGSGNYIIYHGDLSVNENAIMAGYLIENVFSKSGYPSVIAGRKPPLWLLRSSGKYPSIKFETDPGDDRMRSLIKNAHINILPVRKMNGLKLKLLYALFSGRHLIINTEMAKNLPINDQARIADSPEEMIFLIKKLMEEPFTDKMINDRKQFLSDQFSNINNTRKLISII